MSAPNYLEDTAVYLSIEGKDKILFELYHNAYRTIQSVYLFKHFDDYVIQLKASKNEEKLEIYWNTSYYEKLIDYVKISIAFETFNKAFLIDKGYLVHMIGKGSNNGLSKRQNEGVPILTQDFLNVSETRIDNNEGYIYLNGLSDNFQTIKYSHTLNDRYQEIIKLNPELCCRLKEINISRNRLHFFTDFKGAFHVDRHIEKWRFIKEISFQTIEHQLKSHKEYMEKKMQITK